MMTKEGSIKIVKFYLITSGAGVLLFGRSRIVNMQYFFSSSCLHFGMDQTNSLLSNNDEGRVCQDCNFHYYRGWCLMLGRGYIGH